ncbi:MAG TPA: hypothetical protein VE662_03180 [Solirubrobacterales bacterium]|nr:hypothetical protein [Solirubrobacterales bacterium]
MASIAAATARALWSRERRQGVPELDCLARGGPRAPVPVLPAGQLGLEEPGPARGREVMTL